VRRVKSKTSGGVADDNKVDRDKWNIEISAVEEMTVNRAKDNSERRKSKLREEEREEEELKQNKIKTSKQHKINTEIDEAAEACQ
jgi:hypothetical protein